MIFSYPLKFSDFSTESNFLKLQNKYAAYDERNVGLDEYVFSTVVKEDFSIIYKSVHDFNIKSYDEISFHHDFLVPKINSLAVFTISKINGRIKKNFLYNDIERESFIKFTLNEVNVIYDHVANANYLPSNIINKLKNELENVIDFLSTYNLNSNFGFREKLQFNLNKTDLMVLMYLLRKNNIVNTDHTDADFGKLIERFFQYQNTSTKDYTDVGRARKELNDFKNSNDTFAKSIARLKDLLQDDLFYK